MVSSRHLASLSQRLVGAVELQDVLDAVVGVAHSAIATPRVVLRLFNPRTRLFEARAFGGLDAAELAQMSNSDVTRSEFDRAVAGAQPRGHCFALACEAHGGLRWSAIPAAPVPDLDFADTALGHGADELWICPLEDLSAGVPGGYLVFPAPEAPLEDADAFFQVLASQASMAIDRSRLRARLGHREAEVHMASEKLEDLKRLKDNIISSVGHELRTPLTSVKAYAEMLQRGLGSMPIPTAGEFVEVILNESQRLNDALDDILDMSHLENRRQRLVLSSFDVVATTREIAQEVGQEFVEKGVALRVDVPDTPVTVRADRSALRQVLQNMLANSLKFTPSGGDVSLVVRPETRDVRFELTDTGIGIPAPEMSHVFDRFYQVDNSSTRAFGGQGLGLSICRDLVEWHGGRIWAESGEVEGTRLVVKLPFEGLVVASGNFAPSERRHREQMLQRIANLVAELTATRAVSILLADEEGTLSIEAALGIDEETVRDVRVRSGEGVSGLVYATGETLMVADLAADARFRGRKNDLRYPDRSLLSCPLRHEGRTIGVLNVNNKVDGGAFDTDDQSLLEGLAPVVAVALARLESFQTAHAKLAAAHRAVRAMTDVARDRRSLRREALADAGLETGRRMGMSTSELQSLSLALRTYDLGMAEVSETIRRKATPLNAEELHRVQLHAQEGVELMGEVNECPQLLRTLLHHHENTDGSGYPEGIRGEAIPMGARIVRLVDALGALLEPRPFRSALSLPAAMDFVRGEIGTRFCARVAPVFLEIIEEKQQHLMSLPESGERVHPASLVVGDDLGESPVPVGAGVRESS